MSLLISPGPQISDTQAAYNCHLFVPFPMFRMRIWPTHLLFCVARRLGLSTVSCGDSVLCAGEKGRAVEGSRHLVFTRSLLPPVSPGEGPVSGAGSGTIRCSDHELILTRHYKQLLPPPHTALERERRVCNTGPDCEPVLWRCKDDRESPSQSSITHHHFNQTRTHNKNIPLHGPSAHHISTSHAEVRLLPLESCLPDLVRGVGARFWICSSQW